MKSFLARTGISQTDLAERLGVTQAAISYWSSGSNTPSMAIAKKLIFMGMTMGELFDAETEAFLFKGRKVNRRRMSADVVETALVSLVDGDGGAINDKDACLQIVKIGLEELYKQKAK